MAVGASARKRALTMVASVAQHRPEFDFIVLAIQGKKIGFEKVIKMIDDMVATLKTEQQDDDKKKGLERSVSDLETMIEDAKEGISTAKADIKTLQDTIKALDKSVSEAIEQRKE